MATVDRVERKKVKRDERKTLCFHIMTIKTDVQMSKKGRQANSD